MLIFLFIVITYVLANTYLFFKLIHSFQPDYFISLLIGALILFMILSPVLIPVYSHRGSHKTVTIYSYIGYLWLAFLVPFFTVGIALDLYNHAIHYGSSLATRDLRSMMLSEESTFYISLLLSLAVIAYGYFEAKNIRVEKLIISTSKLPEGANRVRVAQISDLHLGVTVGEGILDKVINNINEEKPDIIVSTGDLVDGIIRHVNHLEERLKNIHAPLGKYAVIGNHELYGGINKTAQFIEDSGFKLLRGDGVTVDNTINIAGMDFLGGEAGRYIDDSSLKQEHDVLSNLTPGLFTLLLKHRSDVENESLGLFDLQLSGHTHKGQIFPMSLVTMLLFQYHTGFNRLENGSAIYTSRGTGTAGPPIRFLSTPEITIIDIVPR